MTSRYRSGRVWLRSCRASGLRWVLLLALVAVRAPAEEPWAWVPERLVSPSSDHVRAETAVPDEERQVGEVRLLSRGTARVVQTRLQTRILARVVAEIAAKERLHWDDDTESAAYVAALDMARRRIESRSTPDSGSERRRQLWIEFVVDGEEGWIFLGTVQPQGGEPVRELLSVLRPRLDYVARNQRLILADSFRIPDDRVDQLGETSPGSVASPLATGLQPVPTP